MTTIARVLKTLPTSLLSSRRSAGWIGVDIGTRTVKLAQVERRGGGWRLSGLWTIEHASDLPLVRSALGEGELSKHTQELRKIRRLFRGRSTAATLPTSHVDFRALDIPSGPWQETKAILDQELAADPPGENGDYEFDAWQATSFGSTTKVLAVAAERCNTVRVASDLLSAGFECSVIDAVPCALARAVTLCDPAAQQETVAALDFGHSTALLVVVHQGRPVFCRLLRGCGLQSLMQPLIDKLGITDEECRHLLLRFGIPAETAGSPAARSTYQVMSHGLNHLAEELRRTLSYASQQLRLRPNRIWMFGGGATIRNSAEFVSQQTQIASLPWRLSKGDGPGNLTEPLFGAAAGLSLLAWEDSKCM